MSRWVVQSRATPCICVKKKHEAALEKDATLDSLQTDRVFDYSFDPLQGGFTAQSSPPFDVVDRRLQVPPTKQITPVEVPYDPKAGMQS
jgi:hypothetical protein